MLNRQTYINLLAKMIAQTEKLQNKPPSLIPQEDLIADIVQDYLKGCKNIDIQRVSYVQGRSNLVITYYSQYNSLVNDRVISFVGSHMDVVPASKTEWKHNPFVLTVDSTNNDILHGRGTTDCLGHVALMTILLKDLSDLDIKLDYRLVVVFIANEENGEDPNIGIEHLMKDGYLDRCKNGPVYWLDSAGIHPTVGTGSGVTWSLKVTGKGGHSAFPENTINPIILGNQVVDMMIKKFNELYPEHPNDREYGYHSSSNFKPTRIHSSEGSINQIPESTIIEGDVRATGFYDIYDIMKQMEKYADDLSNDLNNNLDTIPSCHPSFKYKLSDGTKAKIEFKWIRNPYPAVLCNINSIGFKLLSDITFQMTGEKKMFATLGSLPLISELKKHNFDVQIVGYGVTEAYHANNEFCKFSHMALGYDIIRKILDKY
jgi:acetylornithine deacetylase